MLVHVTHVFKLPLSEHKFAAILTFLTYLQRLWTPLNVKQDVFTVIGSILGAEIQKF